MKTNYDIFIKAIHDKVLVKVKVDSYEKGIIDRTCVPFDFGPSKRYKDTDDRYHFYDLDSPEKKHTLSIKIEQLLDIQILEENFEPSDYVKWTPNWFVIRDWGSFS